MPLTAPELSPLDSLPPPLSAQTYIYAGPLKGLSPELWSYEDFVRENAWKWVGRGALDDNYAEVDHRREMNGKTLPNGQELSIRYAVKRTPQVAMERDPDSF